MKGSGPETDGDSVWRVVYSIYWRELGVLLSNGEVWVIEHGG